MVTKFSKYEDFHGRDYMGGLDQNLDDVIERTVNDIRSFGPKNTLTHLIIHSIASEEVANDPFIHRDEAGLPQQLFRYGIGLAMSIDPTENIECSEVTYFDIVHDLRAIWIAILVDETQKDAAGSISNEEFDLSSAARDRELTVSRMAFSGQYLDEMRRGYTPFQHEFFEYKGLDISQSVEYAKEMVRDFTQRLHSILNLIVKYKGICLQILGRYQNWQEKNTEGSISQFRSSPVHQELKKAENQIEQELYDLAQNKLWVSENGLHFALSPRNERKPSKFIQTVSSKIQDRNFRSPFGHNPFDEFPLIEYQDEYLVTEPMFFAYSLAQRFFYTLRDIERQEDEVEVGNRWGAHFEHWASDSAYLAFPEENVMTSVHYKTDKDRESDMVINHDGKLLVCECKGQRITLDSRRGDLESLKGDMLDGIGKGAKQATQLINGIKEDEKDLEFLKKHSDFSPHPDDFSSYLPVVILGLPYDRLGTSEYVKILKDSWLTPFVVSVYDWEIICDLLTPDEIIEYISERINMNRKRYARGMDEQDYLGHYVSGRLEEFKPILEAGVDENNISNPTANLILQGGENIVQNRIGNRYILERDDPIWIINRN